METMCTNVSLNDMAMSIIQLQNRCPENTAEQLDDIMKRLKHNSLIPSISVFELVEVYLNSHDKNAFCVLFATLTGTTWSGFMSHILETTRPQQSVQMPAPVSNVWTAQDNRNLATLLKLDGEFSRRLTYVMQIKHIGKSDLAKQANIGRTTLYRYTLSTSEAQFSVPTAKRAKQIIQALCITPSVFCVLPNDFQKWKQQF